MHSFTSKRAGEKFIGHPVEYEPVKETIGSPLLFVLPSPSGAARRYWLQKDCRGLATVAQGDHHSCAVAPAPPLKAVTRVPLQALYHDKVLPVWDGPPSYFSSSERSALTFSLMAAIS